MAPVAFQTHFKEQSVEQPWLAPVPIARSMALVGLIFVVIFFGIGLFSEINNQNLNDDMLKSSGWKLLLVQLFLLSAVGCRLPVLERVLRTCSIF